MYWFFLQPHTAQRALATGTNVGFRGVILQLAGDVIPNNGPEDLAVEVKDAAVLRVAQTNGIIENRLENRFRVGRRTGDDAENLAGRRLLCARLGELATQPLDFIFPT
jgi:hypothetical protein